MHIVRRWIGLGLVAGAVLLLPALAHAQVRPDTARRVRPDSAKVDSAARKRDSTLIAIPGHPDTLADTARIRRDTTKKVPKDTIKAPLARAEMPADVGIARRLHWVRDTLDAQGAITVADLLERVTGVSTLRTGWISSPMDASYLGQIHHVRVFYDGVEIPSLDPRTHGELDLTQINLWSAEEADVEQAPEEIRVYVRSWRVNNTTPVTRTDIATGDQQTNLYRGFFGKRFDNGLAFQFGAQQYGTSPPSSFGSSSDQLGVIGRVGWARNNWSADAYITRISRHRGSIIGLALGDSIRGVESARSVSYARVGYGDPDTSHVWGQLMAVSSKYDYTGVRTFAGVPQTPQDSALAVASLDTGKFQAQYIATAGIGRGPLRGSVAERFFSSGGQHTASTALRGSFLTRYFDVSAFAQTKSADSIERSDITARFTPLSFISVLGSAGRSSDHRFKDSTFKANYLRAEAGLRIHNLWFVGGVIRRDSVQLDAPILFDTLFAARSEGPVNGITAAIRGQLWRLIHADISAIRWSDTTGFYRPRYQTRSELYLQTNLIKRFPSNHFGIKASAVHEYRSNMRFPLADSSVATALGYRTISTLLEIRILDATLSWQFRNVLGERYTQVPSFLMPRQTNFYGVRWQFVD